MVTSARNGQEKRWVRIHELGTYKLLKKLGEGGMGAVYLAEDPKAGTKVALKVLPKQYATNDEFLKRFRREADAVAKLKHPNIAGALESGQDLGYHFYTMEYCEGESLDRRLARERTLPWSTAADLVLQAARGLQFAHAHGFVHRDIKPANLFLTKDGVVKVLDLGLSKRIVEESGLTVTGTVLGTPHYLSPEQAAGEKEIDGRADLYSLGATFYHLLTGEPPFSGASTLEIIAKHVNAQLPNPQDIVDDVPDGVVHVIRRMMAKRPGDRYPHASALLADLEEVARGGAPKSEALDPARSTVAPPRRRRTLRRPAKKPAWIPWAVGLGLLLVPILIIALRPSPEPPRPPEAKKTAAVPPPPPPPAPEPRKAGVRNLLAEGKPAEVLFAKIEGWALRQGVLQLPAGRNGVATTRETFSDGEIRIRFESQGATHFFTSVRLSAPGAYHVYLPGTEAAGAHELVFTCRGRNVTATLDGKPRALQTAAGDLGGAIMVGARGEAVRVLAIEVRPLP